MTTDEKLSEAELLKHHLEKLSGARRTMQEFNVEIVQVRQDARTDGFNMEALDQLATAIAKSPHDNGAGLIKDTIRYARLIGLEIGEVESPRSDEKFAPPPESDVIRSSASIRGSRWSLDVRAQTLIQLVLGVGVCWMLIELLR